jgi:hypothetical protein
VTATDVRPPQLPAAERRAETRAAARVVVAAVALAALCGAAWGFLAPAQQLLVIEPDRGVPLTGESYHRFDALALFVCAGVLVGAVTALSAWQWRRMRGPVLFVGVFVGAAVGNVAMWLIGEWVARLHHPRPAHAPLHAIVDLAPTVGSDAGLYAAPFTASVVMAALVLLSPRDDLGVGADAPPEAGEQTQPSQS